MRTDFNITTGAQNDFIERIKYKSKMKESYIAAGVPVARHHMVSTLAAAKAFIKEVGYPVIVKPDNGCGAEATYKLRNLKELKAFYAEPHAVPYIMEEFINGTIVSFDGVADSHCVPLFYTSNVFPTCRAERRGLPHHQGLWRQEPVLPLRVLPAERGQAGSGQKGRLCGSGSQHAPGGRLHTGYDQLRQLSGLLPDLGGYGLL